jgi:RsiW-degrading membrane proteinase PrsW (M82 family)
MIEALAMVSAIVPTLLFLWYFHSRDKYREPRRVVWGTFGLGVLSIVPVCIVAAPFAFGIAALFGGNPPIAGFAEAFFVAAIPEETLKLAVLSRYAGRHQAFDEPMDGLVYGAAASLGFATLENVLYVSQGSLWLAITRAITAVPMHAGCGAIMGYFYGRSRFDHARRGRLLALAFLVPVLIHGLYDFPLLSMGGFATRPSRPPGSVALFLLCVSTIFLLVCVAGMFVVVRRARREQAERGPPLPLPPRPPKLASAASVAGGFALLVPGGLVASAGGLALFGLPLALVSGSAPPEGGAATVAVMLALFGALPIAIGCTLFAFGIRLLNRPKPSIARA